jgi:hypothetical protein
LKIYIYGNQSFKKEIHTTLESANIKYKLDNNVIIEEIKSVTKLKETINEYPNDIYLIDDDKIIKNKSINKKLKFLAPKDGIEEEYLLQSGVADLAIDSLKELPKYILKKFHESQESKIETEKEQEPKKIIEEDVVELDDELAMLLSKKQENDKDNYEMKPQNELDELFSLDNNINSDRIGDFNESENNLLLDENFNNDFGLNNISYDYDDDDISNKEGNTSEESEDIFADLSFLDDKLEQDDFVELDDKHDDMFSELDSLSEKQSDIFEELNFLNEEKIEEVKEFDLQEDAEEKFEEFDFFNENINNNQEKEEFFKGEKMDNEFYELDLLNEKDVIDALNYKIEDYNPINNKEIVSEVKKETISVDGTNVNDLSLLLSKLLSNKTVEITIKIKF